MATLYCKHSIEKIKRDGGEYVFQTELFELLINPLLFPDCQSKIETLMVSFVSCIELLTLPFFVS